MIELLVHRIFPGIRLHSKHVEYMISEQKKETLYIILNLKN